MDSFIDRVKEWIGDWEERGNWTVDSAQTKPSSTDDVGVRV